MNNTKPNILSITGPDDKTSITRLEQISKLHPEVEWGILVFPEHLGRPRVPGALWVDEFLDTDCNRSAHLCGKEIFQTLLKAYDGYENGDDVDDLLTHLARFDKVQLNINSRLEGFSDKDVMRIYEVAMSELVIDRDRRITLQYNDRSAPIIKLFLDNVHTFYGISMLRRCEILFDSSLGRGTVTETYPEPLVVKGTPLFAKYAGGLNPENIARHNQAIRHVVGFLPYGLDLESGARSENNEFDFDKVERIITAF